MKQLTAPTLLLTIIPFSHCFTAMASREGNDDSHKGKGPSSPSSSHHDLAANKALAAENEHLKEQLEEMKRQLLKLKQQSSSRREATPPRGKPKKSPSPEPKRAATRWLPFGASPSSDPGPHDDHVPLLLQAPDGLHHRHSGTAAAPLHKSPEKSAMDARDRVRKGGPTSKMFDIDEELGPHDGDGDNDDGGHDMTFCKQVCDRAAWLVGLLVLQSMSSFIIAHNEALLKRHLVIVQFLTMLVGAGGNAGNQATVRVIRGLAIGTVNSKTARSFVRSEFLIGACLSMILGVAGFLRAMAFSIPLAETISITAALFLIVFISVAIGATLPLGMKYMGIDPAHSSTTIQVLMDILGVTITVYVSGALLDTNLGEWLALSKSDVASYLEDGSLD
jgi:cation transporter-like permease